MTRTHVELNSMPSLWLCLLRALTSTKTSKLKPDIQLPDLHIKVDATSIDKNHLMRYRKIVSDRQESSGVPISYPQVIAYPLLLELLLNSKMPFRAMGLVHVRQDMRQYAEISQDAPLTFTCHFGTANRTHRGFEFEVLTLAFQGGARVWESTALLLARQRDRKFKREKKKSSQEESAAVDPSWSQESWSLPADLGWRYALLSGDLNPIHLFPFSARLFGFSRPIIHGLWLVGRVAAHFARDQYPTSLSMEFKAPILLPSAVHLSYLANEQLTEFKILNTEKRRVFAEGRFVIKQP